MCIVCLEFLLVIILQVQVTWSRIPFPIANQFKQDWCRQRKAALDWQSILEPCKNDMQYGKVPRSNLLVERTSHERSLVRNMRIRPAGQFSSVLIESRDAYGRPKAFGGDSWRVMVRSNQATVAADVFDYNNGSYEALFLLTDPGTYNLHVILDYTLCDGLRNPPVERFHKVHCSGALKNQKDIGTELFADMKDYINQPLSQVVIAVPASEFDPNSYAELLVQAESECSLPCRKLWDGYGRWESLTEWAPDMHPNLIMQATFGKRNTLGDRFDVLSNHLKQNGIFWIYGDSLSFYFYESFSRRLDFCQSTFRLCNVSYNWIYPKTLYELTETCAETELNITKVLHYLRQVTGNPAMDQHSALVFNAGAHYVKTVSFDHYKKAIEDISQVLSKESRAKTIWKSTSAIHDQTATVMGSFRRFTTSHRVKLFNAYSNSVMCSAGITFLDIYPISASYPLGTKDGIHYTPEVFMPVEELLVNYFNNSPYIK